MIITKRLLQSKLMKLTTKYTEIQSLEAENLALKEKDSKIYLQEIVQANFNARKQVVDAEKQVLKDICKATVKDLTNMKDQYIKSKSKAKDPAYKQELDHMIKLASVSTNAQLKLIKFMKENNDIRSLEFLTVDDPSTASDRKINLAISKALNEIKNDNITAVLDKAIQDLQNGLRGNMLESTIKFYIEKDPFSSLDEVKPFTATEMANYKKSTSHTPEEEARYKVTAIEYEKRRNGQDYDPIIDQV